MGRLTMGFALLLLASSANAQSLQSTKTTVSTGAPVETYQQESLADVLTHMSKRLQREITVAVDVPKAITLGAIRIEALERDTFITVLRNNGLILFDNEHALTVMRAARARQMPAPLVQSDAADVHDDTIVTRILTPKNLNAARTVPILRPLMPQYGHLAADSVSNTLVIVDHYANVRRISAIVAALDAESPAQDL